MFNYNLINPINITYRNPKQNPALKGALEEESSAKKNAKNPINPDENGGERHFPNGNKVQIDYTKNKINIAQVIEDFKSTIAAINAPKEVSDEVHSYLGLVEMESKKEAPSREIILSNLKNASKISDKFIEDSLKKPSTVVQDWVNALFLQNIELKSDPGFVNEAFRVQIPDNKKEAAAKAPDSYGSNTPSTGSFDVVSNSETSSYNVQNSGQSTGEPVLGGSFSAVSSENDFKTSALNVYDIPVSRVTLNEITPIGKASEAYFVQNSSAAALSSEENLPQNDLTYSTTAPKSLSMGALKGAVSFEEVNDSDFAAQNAQYMQNTESSAVQNNGAVYKIASSASNSPENKAFSVTNSAQTPETMTLSAISPEERAARRSFVRAKRIVKENGDPKSALKLYDEALKLIQNSGDDNLKAVICFERGKIYDDYFDYPELALQDYNSAVKSSDNNLKTHAHINMGKIYDDYVMFDPAVEQYSLAIETSEAAHNPSGKTKALRYLAALFADRYDKANTETFNALSIDAARETGSKKLLARTMMEAAENFEYVGEDTKALSAYKEAAKVLHSMKEYDLLSRNYEAASEIMDRLGNGAKAMNLLSKALQYRQKAEQ